MFRQLLLPSSIRTSSSSRISSSIYYERLFVSNNKPALVIYTTALPPPHRIISHASTFTRQFFSSCIRRSSDETPTSSSLIFEDGNQEGKVGENRSSYDSSSIDIPKMLEDIHRASLYNQGNNDNDNDIGNNKERRDRKKHWNVHFCRTAVRNYQTALEQWEQGGGDGLDVDDDMVSPQVLSQAFSALLRCNWPPTELSRRVRDLEKLIGKLDKTAMTDELSLKLLEANGKAGNVGRTLSLLKIRESYAPKYPLEFMYALRAIHSASLDLRMNRNVFQGDNRQPLLIDNPTRFLDAILVNMHRREVPLDQEFTVKMLETFACSGRSAKGMHAHYKVIVKKPPKGSPAGTKPKISMKWNNPPPYYKVPSQITSDQKITMPGRTEKLTKQEWECWGDYWSRPLDAAFSFCDSLHNGGVGGYKPMELNIEGWNAMIKVCCHRGAIWRAMQIFRVTMPNKNLQPNAKTYLYLLQALARLGDVVTMQELWHRMFVVEQITIHPRLLEAMIDGLLNKGNVAGSITLTQDVWNKVRVQPPYTTHLKVLEFALANDYIYEAKRYVYVLQQIWMSTGQIHPKLSKPALEHLFEYFGYELIEEDFLSEFRESNDHIPGDT